MANWGNTNILDILKQEAIPPHPIMSITRRAAQVRREEFADNPNCSKAWIERYIELTPADLAELEEVIEGTKVESLAAIGRAIIISSYHPDWGDEDYAEAVVVRVNRRLRNGYVTGPGRFISDNPN